jgi:CheY-like chemotaxis protein
MKNEAGLFNKVVLADDDPDHALIFRIVLKQLGPSKELLIVHDGKELLELLKDTVPDLLFLDLNMPCKNGYDCLTEIRQDAGLKNLPVVVYSSSTAISDIKRSFEHEADLYMVKAFNSFHLRNAMEAILNDNWWKSDRDGQHYYFMNNRFVPYIA